MASLADINVLCDVLRGKLTYNVNEYSRRAFENVSLVDQGHLLTAVAQHNEANFTWTQCRVPSFQKRSSSSRVSIGQSKNKRVFGFCAGFVQMRRWFH